MIDGKPIDDDGSSFSDRLGGAADCREPRRLRVLENNEVGDRSRILSSSVLVLGREAESTRLLFGYPLLPEPSSGRFSRDCTLLAPLPADAGDAVRREDERGEVGLCAVYVAPLSGSGVTALIDRSAR